MDKLDFEAILSPVRAALTPAYFPYVQEKRDELVAKATKRRLIHITGRALMKWDTQTIAARAEQREAARSLARSLLAEVAPKATLTFDPEFGFPFASEGGRLRQYVSMAHGGALVAAAVDDWPVGIDVEPLTRDAAGPAHRIAGPAEQQWLAATKTLSVDGHPVSSSLALWCAKEAAAKGVGLGIRAGIDRLQLDPNDGVSWPVRVAVATPHPPPAGFQVRFFVIQGHLVALAAR